MSIVLAALDTGPTAQSVLEVALRIAELTNSEVEAVHARTADDRSVKLRTDAPHVPLRLLSGPVGPALLAAVDAPGVTAAVMGTKPAGAHQRLLGSTVRHVIERSTKPIVLVPPEWVDRHPFRRIVLPLEGTEASTRPVLEGLLPLVVADVELIVIHVFTESTTPAMLDRPGRDLEILGKEFLTRHLPDQEASIELRHDGPVGNQVAEACVEHGADLIVLSWSQDSTAGRASVIRQVLHAANLPLLLLPLGEQGSVETNRRR